ncbi:MAG TPA: hypothetical protein VNZ22_21125, partial [Bacillota bacterium]|nr:hypothetical protein [Bacillota bacterium]
AGLVKEGGNLSVAGNNIYSSLVPQRGAISSALGYTPTVCDTVQLYRGGYEVYQFDEFDLTWLNSEPVVEVGEAFWIQAATSKTWQRSFSACQ